MRKIFLAPSIVSANFAKLGKNVKEVLSAGCDIIHFDVMDNHYVPNLTIGPVVLKCLRDDKICAPIDVHLMTQSVDNLIPMFVHAGASFITFHPEASNHIDKTIRLIKSYGCKCGLVLNPATSLSVLDYVMDQLDLIVIMGVNPGSSGQKFIPYMLDKIYQVHELVEKFFPDILIEVDGGINLDNILDISYAGANIFVMGSTIFNSNNYKFTIQKIKDKLNILNNKLN